MQLKTDATKAAEPVAANAAAIASVNGEIARLQQDITASNAVVAAKQTQVNNARAELATLVTRQTNLQNETTALNAQLLAE